MKAKASQAVRTAWLAFTALALSLALAGIPRYADLLQTPCSGTACFGAQLTVEAAQRWLAEGQNLLFYAILHMVGSLTIDGLLLSTAAFLIWRKATNRAAVLAAFVGTALATSTLSQALAHTDSRFWLPAHVITFVQMAGLLPLFCLLPDGHFRPSWLRWAALAYVLFSLIYLIPDYQGWLAPGTTGQALWLGFMLISVLIVVATLFYRFLGPATSLQSEQLRWLLAGIALAVPVVLLDAPLPASFSLLPGGAIPSRLLNDLMGSLLVVLLGMFLTVGSITCMLVALVNYEPLEAEVIVKRALVYVALTAFVISVYVIIVGYLSTVFRSDNLLFSLIATGLVAVLFQPLRERLQRAVNRLMYGDRDEPYQVLTTLGERLETALEPAASLSLAVETVATALKLPYVAINLALDGTRQPVATYGRPQAELSRFPLIYAGETIGELEAASRASYELLNQADRRILGQLARQISVAAHAARLAAELQRARLRMVGVREESRLQLGNDLHDGVGHQLTGLARKAEIAGNLLERDPPAAHALLTEITQDLNSTTALVRSLAHQLHPPELELLGLAGALRERVQTNASLLIRLDVPDNLPGLPTGIQTAAYYIALEALTNIEKHAAARCCNIHIALSTSDTALETSVLEMEITDDGIGLSSADRADGLGLLSMQGRAIEVGGTFQVEPIPHGGTRVSVSLPYQPDPY